MMFDDQETSTDQETGELESETVRKEPKPARSRSKKMEADPQPAARPRSAKLSHRGQGTLVVNGISGKVYRFVGHGAVQRVAAGDVEKLLEITRENRGCCGAKAVQRQQLLVTVR